MLLFIPSRASVVGDGRWLLTRISVGGAKRHVRLTTTIVEGAFARTGGARAHAARRGALAFILNEYREEGRCLRLSKTQGGTEGRRGGGDLCPRQKRICHFGIIVVVASAVGGGCSVKQKETDRLHRGGGGVIELHSQREPEPKRGSSPVCPRIQSGRASERAFPPFWSARRGRRSGSV